MSSDPLSSPISMAELVEEIRTARRVGQTAMLTPHQIFEMASPLATLYARHGLRPITFNTEGVSRPAAIIVDRLYELPATMRINAAVPPPPLPHWLRPPNRNYEANND